MGIMWPVMFSRSSKLFRWVEGTQSLFVILQQQLLYCYLFNVLLVIFYQFSVRKIHVSPYLSVEVLENNWLFSRVDL